MTSSRRFSGVLAPVITPFREDLAPDAARLVRHCRWLLSQGVALAVFGTNSEANSLSVEEKAGLLDSLVDAGIDPGQLMPGTGCSALTDTVNLTRHAVRAGCAGVLMLPPFYYKNVSDEGLFRSYAEVIERVGSDRLRIYLYHIPPVAQVGLSVELVDRLVSAFPKVIAGIKDSSGDWNNTLALLERAREDFRVFSGSEELLLRNLRAGGAGCISATANIQPAPMVQLCREWRKPEAGLLQQSLDDLRQVLAIPNMIPALKAVVAHFANDPAWETVRPPLVPLHDQRKRDLVEALRQRGFTMPGYPVS